MMKHALENSSIELREVRSDSMESTKSHEPQDNHALSRTGKKPVLKRNFGFMSILAFNCLVVNTWGGAFALLGVGLENGGPAGLIYGFIIIWIGNLATFACLAELASMAPTAGGQYHWVSLLAPQSCQKSLSYVTGWFTVTGWQASVASSGYVCALYLQGFIQLLDPSYVPQLWHGTLLLYGVLVVALMATTVLGPALPKIESVMFVLYIIGFFAVLIPLVWLAPHGSAKDVFGTFVNRGNWPTQGLSFCVGLSGNAFAFLGIDSAYHMSEEIHNAATVVPRSIMWSILFDGAIGLAMFIAVLFSVGDLEAALNSKYVYPFIEVLVQGTNSIAGSATIVAILTILNITLEIGVLASSSRMLWSFARDRGVPGWRVISQVDPKTSIPIASIMATTFFGILLGLISIGSPVAFNDVLSITVNGLYASYFIACILLLWRRCTGSIKNLSETYASEDVGRPMNLPGSGGNLVWGPWKMREPLGTMVNTFACAYLIFVFFFTFWPPVIPVTPDTMNYSCVVMGFVAIVSGAYYAFSAHKTYTGPIVEVSVRR